MLLTMGVCLSSPQALADGRGGFLLGLALGGHSSDLTGSISDGFQSVDAEGDESGVSFRFTIGGGTSHDTTVYYVNHVNFDPDATYGITGIGGTYYLEEQAPSVYLHGAIGFGSVIPDEDTIFDPAVGGAVMFGFGYEAVDGLHLDLSFTSISATDDTTFFDADIEYDIFSTQLIVGYIWF